MRGLLLILCCFFFAGVGCKGPCQELAENICLCEPNELSRRACVQRVDDETSQRTPTVEQDDHCDELLVGCDEEHVCVLIEQGDLAACGLAAPLD